LIPFEAGDAAAISKVMGSVAATRAKLAKKGVTLKSVLEDGESVRALAHIGHRY
jgi:hypothetical protein